MRWTRRSKSRVKLCTFILLVPFVLAHIVARLSVERFCINDEIRTARRPLWVTAHPDDESFFFGPTLARLLNPSRDVEGGLLCLSVGNHEGLGSIRRRELTASCRVWGIAEENCVSLDNSLLQDDPSVWWNASVVNSAIQRHVQQHGNDLIISFDDYGVSGHRNHRALAAALRTFSSEEGRAAPPIYAVGSTNIITKFSGLLTFPLVLVRHLVQRRESESRSLFTSSLSNYLQAHASFNQHKSQWRWYRTLFVLFSRYLWFVELYKV